ncbi:MAG: aminotransferase class I/II-fold pyridoxal phosphate-dependent enzyme [Ilumatobacteraceae bacterium]|nr:aminotransferase class I/II-fold pyridoxal phosphate-dependent enzyme [Ilumatobacteraceae bacterium]
MHPATTAVAAGRPKGTGAPLNHPVVLASNFRGEEGEYARTHGTPTWHGLEAAVGALEGGRALAYSTGMAAASATLFALAPKVLVLPSYSYLGVRSLVADLVDQRGLDVRFVDVADTAAVLAALPGADMVWMETPTNPTLDVADLATIGAAAREAGAAMVVDSTFATPVCARPLEDGATVVLHSGTKAIGGHSDLMIGLTVTADDEVYDRLHHARLVNGSTPGALEAFLALRGVRTLPLRMERMQANAADLATHLAAHPAVAEVRYPGFGAMVSFVMVGGAAAADAACRAVRLIVPATSLGGVETTMERRQKYAGDAHVPPGLIRMSVGIEHVDDLWADLSAALGSIGA